MAAAIPSLVFALGLAFTSIGVGLEFGLGFALIVAGLLAAALSWLFVRGSWISSARS